MHNRLLLPIYEYVYPKLILLINNNARSLLAQQEFFGKRSLPGFWRPGKLESANGGGEVLGIREHALP